MALLRSFRDVPPGGWRYVQPETGVRFNSDNYDDLVADIDRHRRYKGLPTDTTGVDVQRQICQMLTNGECDSEPGEDYRPTADLTARLTTSMALSLGKTVVAALARVAAGDTPLCSKQEAAARAAVCRGCPLNKPAALCSCSAVYKAIEAAVPKDRMQPGISVCMACGCSLQAKVNLPLEVVTVGNSPDVVFPVWCWQRPGSPLRGVESSGTTT